MLKPGVDTVRYPESDGKPMAENDPNRDELIDAVKELGWWFESRSDVYVSGNLLIFYVPGNRRRHLAPDVFVVFGVEKKSRPNYKIWEEGTAPHVVIEVLSDSTWKRDLTDKKTLYRRLGVEEYYVFDPSLGLPTPPLQGFRLVDQSYRRMRGPVFFSRRLQLELFLEGCHLRFRDRQSGQILLTPSEEREGRLEERRGRLEERKGRLAAEARASALEEELRRIRESRPADGAT